MSKWDLTVALHREEIAKHDPLDFLVLKQRFALAGLLIELLDAGFLVKHVVHILNCLLLSLVPWSDIDFDVFAPFEEFFVHAQQVLALEKIQTEAIVPSAEINPVINQLLDHLH